VHIDEKTALQVTTVYSAVNLIASAIAGLPIDVYQQIEGVRAPMMTPLTKLLSIAPNPEMSAMTFWEQLVSHEVLYGNAYIFVVKSASNQPLELWPLDPQRIEVGRAQGRKIYTFDGRTTGPAMLDFSAGGEIIHVANFGLDSLKGLSPVQLMRESIGLTKASEEYSARFFSTDSTPRGLLTTDRS
jgi:HK97 family phage portal protein